MRDFLIVLIVSLSLAVLLGGIFFLVASLDGYGDFKLWVYFSMVFFVVFTALMVVLALYAGLRKEQISVFNMFFLLGAAFVSSIVFFVINYLIKYLLPGVRQPAFYSFPRNLSFIFGALFFIVVSRPRSRAFRRLVLAFMVGSVAIWAIHSTIGIRFWGSGRFLPEKPNILLLTVESLRNDYLGCNGNDRLQTPSIDYLSKSGLTFDRYFIHVPYTTASLSSLLTGYYPFRHGARVFGQKPDPSYQPFVNELARTGYVVKTDGSYFPELFPQSAEWDIQGASLFSRVLGKVPSIVYILNNQLGNFLPGLFGGYCFGGTTSMRQTSELLRNIRLNKKRTWFFWTHFKANCHWPYETPPQFARLYQKERLSRQTKFYLRNFEQLNQNPALVSEKLRAEIRAAYSAEVSCIDRQIGFIIQQLKRLGLSDRTVVILTTDHGDLLGENGFFGHGEYLREELIHVPLLICGPKSGFFSGGRRIRDFIEEVDIAPTVLDLSGIRPGEAMDGRSLLNLWRTGSWQKSYVYCEVVDEKANFFAGLRSDRFKFIWDAGADKGFLIDLANDPEESRDIADTEAQELEIMKQNLLSLTRFSRLEELKPDPRPQIDERMKEKMRALGYIR